MHDEHSQEAASDNGGVIDALHAAAIAANRALRLPPRTSRLNGAVGVRFTAESIDRIAVVAAAEGMTVSTWVRTEIEKAVERRKATTCAITGPPTLSCDLLGSRIRAARRSPQR